MRSMSPRTRVISFSTSSSAASGTSRAASFSSRAIVTRRFCSASSRSNSSLDMSVASVRLDSTRPCVASHVARSGALAGGTRSTSATLAVPSAFDDTTRPPAAMTRSPIAVAVLIALSTCTSIHISTTSCSGAAVIAGVIGVATGGGAAPPPCVPSSRTSATTSLRLGPMTRRWRTATSADNSSWRTTTETSCHETGVFFTGAACVSSTGFCASSSASTDGERDGDHIALLVVPPHAATAIARATIRIAAQTTHFCLSCG